MASIKGYADFVAMVDQEKGTKFQAQVARIVDKYGANQHQFIHRERWKEPTSIQAEESSSDSSTTTGSDPGVQHDPQSPKGGKWWKFW